MPDQPMSCHDALSELWAYIDQELDASAVDEIRAHLNRCAHCFPQYDFQRAFCQFLAARAHESAPPELRRRIFMQLLEEEKRSPSS